MSQSTAFRKLFLLFAGALAGCGDAPAPPASGPKAVAQVQLERVQTTSLDQTVEVVGTLYGDEEVVISAKVPGRIASISADVGDRVAGGELLAQIDPIDYELEVSRRNNALSEALSKLGLTELPGESFDVSTISPAERARLQAANAKAKFERAKKLFEQQPPLISEQDYADLQTAYDVALRDHEVAILEARSLLAAALSRKTELDAAKQQLSDTRVVPPQLKDDRKFAVASRSVSTGEFVQQGTALFRVLLDDPIKFRGALPERYASQVQPGQAVTLRIAGLDQPAIGTIARTSPAIDLATRTFQVEAIFQNSTRALRPGAFARGTITVGQDKDVMLVPRRAVVSFAGLDKVFAVADGKAIENTVTLGPIVDTNWVSVVRGLENVTDVVVVGNSRLAKGTPVEIQPTAQPTTIPTPSPSPQPATQPAH